jgi:hypothetical protein
MTAYKLISADSHIVEPPDMYASWIEPASGTARPGWSAGRRSAGESSTRGSSMASRSGPWAR